MGDDGERMRDETRFTYDVDESESTSTAVVRAVACVRNRRPTELPPLHDSVDPDALDGLFSTAECERASVGTCVSFDYDDCKIGVSSDGQIVVIPEST